MEINLGKKVGDSDKNKNKLMANTYFNFTEIKHLRPKLSKLPSIKHSSFPPQNMKV